MSLHSNAIDFYALLFQFVDHFHHRIAPSGMCHGIIVVIQFGIGIGITGIAGPGGGTPEKPVGQVHIALCGALGERVRGRLFPGDRERIRMQSTQAALEMLRRALLALAPL